MRLKIKLELKKNGEKYFKHLDETLWRNKHLD
jgi:hypothetical protein